MAHVEYNHSLVVTNGGWVVGIDPQAGHGYFEHTRSGAGGELTFDNELLEDYDGVFELPAAVIRGIEQLGYNADYAKDDVS